MPPEKNEGYGAVFRSYADLWLGLWRYMAILGASLEGFAMFLELRPPLPADAIGNLESDDGPCCPAGYPAFLLLVNPVSR